MKTFLIVERTEPGCDYSIGCGTKLTLREAPSMEELVEELHRGSLLAEEEAYGYGEFKGTGSEEKRKLFDLTQCWADSKSESRRSTVHLYEIANATQLPLREWEAEKNGARIRRRKESDEAKERELFAQLQKKYGSGSKI
jgi:hypothetical protein